jgi:HPt (histidine-containing phosphotransfer) domain-containing protein
MTHAACPPTGEATSLPHSRLDPAALAALRSLDAGAPGGLLARLIPAFERTLDRGLAEMEAATQAEPDLDRIARAAHQLKSACAHVGALDAAAQCGDLERACRAPDDRDPKLALVDLKLTLESVRTAVRELPGLAS